MRITFICAEVSQGGGSRVIAKHALGLRERGHQVKVISRMEKTASLPRHISDRLRGTYRKPDQDKARYFKPLGADHIEVDRVGPLLPEDVPEADIIIATWWRTAFEVATMPPEKGRKTYFVQHHEVHSHLPWDLSAGSYYLPLHKIAVADWIAQAVVKCYGAQDIYLAPNGIDTAQFTAPPRGRNPQPVVGMMYSELLFKGTDIALKAISELRRSFPNLQVIAFGLEEAVSHLPLPENCNFRIRPNQDDIPGLYAACDAWIFSSREEGFGLPLLEALACRTPVVATRAGAAPDLIKDGINGYLLDVEDYKGIADRTKAVLTCPENAWKDMSDAARQTSLEHNWPNATSVFEDALNDILEKAA